MLSQLQDMCTQYWPDKVDGEVTYGKMTIKLLSEKYEKEIVVRKLEISQTLKVVSIMQYNCYVAGYLADQCFDFSEIVSVLLMLLGCWLAAFISQLLFIIPPLNLLLNNKLTHAI